MWLVKAWRPRTLPVAVTLKRFFAPECVFIFGMSNQEEGILARRPSRPRRPLGGDYGRPGG
jgi:hypothetical protein